MTADGRAQILVVEDDVSLAHFLGRLLEAMGHRAHAEHSGEAALAYVAEHDLDLVILDLRLPDMGGYEVCTKLRQQFSSWCLPILILTGMDKPVDQLRGFARGADAYLTKPCDPPELMKTVSLLLGQTAAQ